MARGYNKVMLIGNLTRDPELKYTPNNTAVADMGLAVNREYQDSEGSQQEDVTYVDVTVWSRTAENCSQYLNKGSPVFIEGRLTFDSWETDEGQKRSKLKVTAQRVDFLDSDSSRKGNIKEESKDILEGQEGAVEDDIPF